MGHSPRDVWEYTPRQIAGFLFFAGKRRKREAAEQLAIGANAARGDPKEVKRTIRDWSKD